MNPSSRRAFSLRNCESNGAHDYVYWRNSVGDGLIALLGATKR